MPEQQFDFLELAKLSEEEADRLVDHVVKEMVYKPVEPFEVEPNLRKFLFALRLSLSQPNQWDTLTPVQNAARGKQRAMLILMIQAPCGKDYRKHILSAMIGKTIESQNELDWFQTSKIIDSLKKELHNGEIVLKTIQKDVIEHPSSRPSDLYGFLWEKRSVPDLLNELGFEDPLA